MILTPEQRKALKEVYDRGPLVLDQKLRNSLRSPMMNEGYYLGRHPLTYRQFRRQVIPGWGCIMLHWQNMWLGIEKDGYTHS